MTSTVNRAPGTIPSTVLIVDEDPDVRDALRLLFELEEYRVIAEASGAADAILLAKRWQPNLVILKSEMPRMDGAATAAQIRLASRPTRIVAFSSVLSERPDWADAFLNKERICEIAPLLTALIPEAQESGSTRC